LVNHEIIGDDMQAVIVSLAHGDQIRAEAGGMMFMTDSIEMLFFASLTGPGRVWLQTLPFSRLADRIHAAYKGDRGEVKRDLGGMLGGLGDLLGGDRS
jgi:uncharacterized protein (AIM24 family)